MHKQKVILVFGLPGAGKTTLIQAALKQRENFVRLSGGSLIGAALSEEERDLLRKKSSNDILLNQETLVHNFQKSKVTLIDRHIIFDGHCVVKDGNQITEIPLSVIQRLTPDSIVFIDENPQAIFERRCNDAARPDREKEGVEALEQNRTMQIKICENYASKLGVPLKILHSPKAEDFITYLDSNL